MNWIILIIAGLFEVGFTFCLGKIKGATGTDFYLWGAGFVISVTLSMLPSFVLVWLSNMGSSTSMAMAATSPLRLLSLGTYLTPCGEGDPGKNAGTHAV